MIKWIVYQKITTKKAIIYLVDSVFVQCLQKNRKSGVFFFARLLFKTNQQPQQQKGLQFLVILLYYRL